LQANHLAAITANSAAVNQVFNVAHGERTTLNELYEIIREIIGRSDPAVLSIDAVYGPSREGDIPHSLASVSKASEMLGYKPVCTVREGLEEAVKWFMENL
jgi:UDP-N-acetylglucosamine/UDP-N-acetylgalactosamine 4-epimerase